VIDYIIGNIQHANEKTITIDMRGFGVSIFTPQPESLEKNKEIKLFTYLHWNAENGPSLFGFANELTRKIFLLLLDCPKIGPSIALTILAQLTPAQFLDIITSQDETRLSAINGIGPKKAEQLIVQLKHKVQKLLSSGSIVIEQQESFVQWQNVNDVLTSLNYSRNEISQAMNFLAEKYGSQNSALDQLIRAALSYLSQKRV
jgi:Holliday junction DNA helicase RuvA